VWTDFIVDIWRYPASRYPVLRPFDPLMGFFDESFSVQVPWGRAGHRPSKLRQFHTPFTTVSSKSPSKFIFRTTGRIAFSRHEPGEVLTSLRRELPLVDQLGVDRSKTSEATRRLRFSLCTNQN